MGKPSIDLASFRPVTLTSTVLKVMEKIVCARIRDTVESKLTVQQSGFHPGHSTLNQLLHLRAALCRPHHDDRTGAVFVDYAEAFDTVDHATAVRAMQEMGIPTYTVKWTATLLQGRKKQVRVKKVFSGNREFTRGVPQGTVLGPLLS